MYYLLTESFKSQETKLVALIQETMPVEKIYMLGSRLAQQRTESIFMTDAPSCRNAGHYWLLVLVDKDCGHSNDYVQDKIENNCRSFIPVTVVVLKTEQFNNWLNEGHRFAYTVIKIAVLLHDSTNMPLVIPERINEEAVKRSNEKYYARGVNMVNEFIAGAELYRVRVQNKMAAFMLHQAAEHALRAIFKATTGLHINTHNIDKLIRYCTMVNYKIPAVFPRNNDTGERLFQLLQKAYIDTRYKDEFTISNSDILALMQSIRTLQEIMQDVLH
jgi:HEPN domain-containing protein